MDLFIESYQPFSLEKKAFKNFASWIPGYSLPSRKTISNAMIPALYEDTKEKVLLEINNVRSHDHIKLCLTTDMWTSRENENFIAVTGHFISEDYQFKSILIECFLFEDTHSSANIQSKLLQIINEWGLRDKINFIVSDNAANIQKAIADIGWKHYGCYGHTLNLLCKMPSKQSPLTWTKSNNGFGILKLPRVLWKSC